MWSDATGSSRRSVDGREVMLYQSLLSYSDLCTPYRELMKSAHYCGMLGMRKSSCVGSSSQLMVGIS